MSGAYYNEIDPYAVEWLKTLIMMGEIEDGEVDSRPIQQVRADDLKGFLRCHFFAGIAGWGRALSLANWPEDREVWTGSCPCQPFSVAGKQKAQSDERHLWPSWYRLIQAVQPATIFGEQVAGAINARISDEEMFCVLNAETPVGVQKIWGQIKGWSTASMQSMSTRVREELALRINRIPASGEAKKEGQGKDLCSKVDREEQSKIFNFSNKEAMPEERNAFRSGRARSRNISADFLNEMRNYWLSSSGKAWEARLQQPLYRQDYSLEGVRLQQRKNSLLRDKCSDGELGISSIGDGNKAMEGLLNELKHVATKAGTRFTKKVAYGWLDDVYQGLEGEGYAVGSAVLPACSVGAPHKRDRLWFVADARSARWRERLLRFEGDDGKSTGERRPVESAESGEAPLFMADATQLGRQQGIENRSGNAEGSESSEWAGSGSADGSDALANTDFKSERWPSITRCERNFWQPESGVCKLAHGVPARVGRLRAYGNAIVPPLAAEFISAFLEAERDL